MEIERQYKTMVYKRLCDEVAKSHIVDPNEIGAIFTKDLTIPEDYNFVILDAKFTELQYYGDQLLYLKNLLDEHTSYALFVSKQYKDRIDYAKKMKTTQQSFDDLYKEYTEVHKEYLAWKFFYGTVKDKWELLDRAIGHIRACVSTLRENMKMGVEPAQK